MTRLALILAASVCIAPENSRAGGGIEGTVKLEGPPPALAPLKVTKDGRACGKELPNEAVQIGSGGALKNVVVSIKGLKPPTPPAGAQGAVIDQRSCQYVPHVQAVTVGTRINVVNNDAILHNVHANAGPKTIFNLAMPIKGLSLFQTCSHPGLLKLTCDAGHPWMSAYVWVFEHPYYAVTGADGSFRILDVPPGEYTLEYWHESIDGKGEGVAKTAPITVTEGAMVRADASMKL